MPNWLILTLILLAACLPASPTPTQSAATAVEQATAGPTEPLTPTETPTPENSPTPLPPPTAIAIPTIPPVINELPGSTLPPGFSIIKFAELYRPTAFAFDSAGRLLATSVDGNVYLLTDADGDGRADEQHVFAAGYYTPLGVTVQPGTGDVFVSYQGAIARLRDTDGDGVADESTNIITGLPFGRHQNDNLKFGPDGWLYMGIGSTCDACFEEDYRSATIMRFDTATLAGEVFATGMRNPYDLAFHPLTGALFATDNGRDDLGLEAPHEELNHIIAGGNYGFPGCWDAHDQSGCAAMLPPVALFESHSSANGLDIYGGTRFPEEYRYNAFVSILGSWLKPGVQTGVQRVALTPEGDVYLGEAGWFIQFPEGAMPLALLFGPDDALYVGDYINDAIYRVSYGIP